ncbi:MAG TPA: CarD family transcriptional regulator [Clostridiales bacterium]|nr:CarD family transcriptional regulator [Clostridiales bacterium]
MFNIGDLIVYSAHGICRIVDIQEKTYLGVTKKYYILHPLDDDNLKISIPVDSKKVVMLELLDKDEAQEILESFKLPGVEWIEADNQRYDTYLNMVKEGNRKEIARIANTLMRQKIKLENGGRKFHERDRRLLTSIQDTLFSELAYALNTTYEAIYDKIMSFIS